MTSGSRVCSGRVQWARSIYTCGWSVVKWRHFASGLEIWWRAWIWTHIANSSGPVQDAPESLKRDHTVWQTLTLWSTCYGRFLLFPTLP